MKRAFISVLTILLLVVCVSAKDVLVTGTVKSYATGDPIANAAVFAIGANLTMTAIPDSVDTFYTDDNGAFSKTIQVLDADNVLAFGAQKDGYLIKTSMIPYIFTPIPTEADLGDILLKTIDDATDTLEVSGVVVDSVTQSPVADASIILTSGVIGDIVIDTFKTDNVGVLDVKMAYIPGDNPMFNFIFYGVSKDLYESVADSATIDQNNSVDLGTVELVKINTPITPIFNHMSSLLPTHFSVYSLQGKKIYSGSLNDFSELKSIKFSNQQFVIRYFRNEHFIGSEKVLNK